MAQGIFTEEFYKGLYKHLIDVANDGMTDDTFEHDFVCFDYVHDDGTYVAGDVRYDTERSYYSPWDAPYDETWDIIATDVIAMRNVKVYAESRRGAEEIDGFSFDDFKEATKDYIV